MKTWQLATIAALILGLGAFIYFKDKKKCNCGHDDPLILDDEGE